MKHYILGDRPTREEFKALGLDPQDMTAGPLPSFPGEVRAKGQPLGSKAKRFVRAIYTGTKRPPRKGEWYLSGSTPAAYRAPNDLSSTYHIAKLVVVEERTTTTSHVVELEPIS